MVNRLFPAIMTVINQIATLRSDIRLIWIGVTSEQNCIEMSWYEFVAKWDLYLPYSFIIVALI